MTIILKLLRYNDILAPSISLAGNFMLLYLIITVNKVATKEIKFVLIPNCVLDILLALTTFTLMPQVFNIKLTAYIVCASPLTSYDFFASSFSMWIYGAFLITAMNGSCITFYIRYRYVCHNNQLTIKLSFILYFSLFLLFLVFFFLFRWCFPVISDDDTHYRADTLTDFWLEEYPNGGPKFVAAQVDEIKFIIPYSLIFITVGINYSLVFYFGIKITRTLRIHVNSFSASQINTSLNKQLHINLIVQTIMPFIVLCLPVFILVGMMFLKYENLNLSLFLSFFYGWMPVVNPLSAIFIISSYRKRILSMFGIKQKVTTAIPTVVSQISIKI